MRKLHLTLLILLTALGAETALACGTPVELAAHGGTSLRYGLSGPDMDARAALVLLPGGGGFIDLDRNGCPRQLTGNSLIRQQPHFHAAGLVTALVDAPSDHQGQEGLGEFRIDPDHAADIGKVIADLRHRTGLPVWLVGTSRGAISAANAAARLTGAHAADGLVLTSPVTAGLEGARKPWVAHSVFSLDLDAIRMPVLVVVHAEDKCVRTPPDLADKIAAETTSPREQTVTVSGGPGWSGETGVKACRGKSPHGFLEQEAEVAAGIARFIAGGQY